MNATRRPPARSGLADRIQAFVASRPGCSGKEIAAATGSSLSGGMLTYCQRTERIFAAGPRRLLRYFATEQMAMAAHAGLVADAARREKERLQRHHRVDNARKKAVRNAKGIRPINTRPAAKKVAIPPGVYCLGGVRMTIAETPKDLRYTVEKVAEPLLSALGIGRYLDRDTAVSRAYALASAKGAA